MDKITIDTYNKQAADYDNETADFWKHFQVDIINEFSKRACVKGDGTVMHGKGLESRSRRF